MAITFLTDADKAQLQSDIDKRVKFTEPQALTEEQKAQARENIGAGDVCVRPDWNQADEEAPDYIKNRPFYVDGGVVVEEQTITIEFSEEWSATLVGTGELVEGKTYLVNFNGTEYRCTAYGLYDNKNYGEFDGVAIGNIDIALESNLENVYENKGNGEPFAVKCYLGDFIAFATPGEHTIEIANSGDIVIDDEYRNVLNVTPDWDQADENAPDYIKNRPYFTEYGPVVAEEQTVVVSSYGEVSGRISGFSAIEAGKTYDVVFEGMLYTCVAYHPVDENGDEKWEETVIGNCTINIDANAGLSDVNVGNGEPFAVSSNGYVLFTAEGGNYRISIVEVLNVTQIPVKYLPLDAITPDGTPPDWNQNDETKPDYIKNRPFYTTYGAVIAEEQTVTTADKYDEGSFANLSVLGVLEVGKTYHVLFNGTAYDCVAYHPMTEYGKAYDNYIVIGSSVCLRGFIPESLIECGNGEPFAIVQYDGSTQVYAAEDGTYTLKVTEVTDVVKLDRKYLDTAQADWKQNDESQPDFVKNRPMYMADPIAIVQEQTLTTADDGESICADLSMNVELEVGKTYTVTFNGASYKCTAYHPIIFGSETDETDTDYIYLGESTRGDYANPGYTGHGKNEPFLIIKYPHGGGDYLYTENEGVYTIKVTSGGVVIDPVYREAITAILATVEMVATLEDGTKQTLKLYGEVVQE